ncbi:MAG: hypothetical protein PHR77_10545 [Kiritimatiellae bacterium]|nr:hypothetical protein [Kiritimatiellia bacterium]
MNINRFLRITLSFCFLTVLFTTGTGCAKKKPEGSTGPLANLYSALSDVVILNRQYKTGSISRQAYEITNSKLERIITEEFTSHKNDVWSYSSSILSNTPISKATSTQVYQMKPVRKWPATDEWKGDLEPLPAMFSMLPLQMTMTVIKPALTPSEYNNLTYAFRPVELIYLDKKNCTTAFMFGYKIITVDFTKLEFRWKPEEIRLYIKSEKTDQNLKTNTAPLSAKR